MIKALFSRQYILLTVLIVVLCATFVSLAIWQWNRHQIQLAEDETYLAQLAEDTISLNTFADTDALLTMTDRAVEAAGQFDYAHQRILKNQVNELGQGIHLIAPFVIEGTNTAVLVDRGWLEVTAELAQFNENVEVLYGRIRQADRPLNTSPETELFRVSVADLQSQIPYDLLPIIITQLPLDTDDRATRPLRFEPTPRGQYNGSSLGYMIQWLAFALIFGVGYLFYIRRATQN